jgi:hypothetical protein
LKTYELYLDGMPVNEMKGIGEYIVSLDNVKAHDIILKVK